MLRYITGSAKVCTWKGKPVVPASFKITTFQTLISATLRRQEGDKGHNVNNWLITHCICI
jgi:hypothetical protein